MGQPRRRSKVWVAVAAILVPLLVGSFAHLFRAGKQPSSGKEAAESPAASSEKSFSNSLDMKLVLIPDGDFFMGSTKEEDLHHRPDEGPSHRVTIAQPFYLGVYPVTVGNFRAFVESDHYVTEAEKAGAGHSWRKPGWEQNDDYPVACVSWHDAKAFCDWISKKEDRIYRLPTEAEWEYACRAGSPSAYCFGADTNKLDDYAWHKDNSGGKAHPVGQKKRNRWDLHDMHGNLLEWCGDIYDAEFYDKMVLDDPRGPSHGGLRVLRGGSWDRETQECRSARRYADRPTVHGNDRGFRVVLVPAG